MRERPDIAAKLGVDRVEEEVIDVELWRDTESVRWHVTAGGRTKITPARDRQLGTSGPSDIWVVSAYVRHFLASLQGDKR